MAAGKLPKRTTSPGTGATQKKAAKGPVVGYGMKGGKFKSQKAYNQSKSGQEHAKNPNLSKTPLGQGAKGNAFFNAAKYEASKAGKAAGGHISGPAPFPQPHGASLVHNANPSAGQRASASTAQAGKAMTITSHPAAMPKSIRRV